MLHRLYHFTKYGIFKNGNNDYDAEVLNMEKIYIYLYTYGMYTHTHTRKMYNIRCKLSFVFVVPTSVHINQYLWEVEQFKGIGI